MTGNDLDDLLAEARMGANRATASPALLARVMADALDHLPAPEPVAPPRPAPRGAGLWATVLSAFGGGGVLAGGVAAGLVGVWIGFAGAGAVPAVLEAVWPAAATDSVELMPGFGDYWMEG